MSEAEWGSAFYKMNDYRRFIAYIYEYDGKVRLGNKGFARIDVRNGRGRLFVSMKDVKKEPQPLGVFFYHWKDGIMQSVKVEELEVSSGMGELKAAFLARNIAGGLDFEDVGGIVLGGPEGRMYGAEWDQRDINMAMLDFRGATVADLAAAECSVEEVPETEAITAGESGRATEEEPIMDWHDIFAKENILQPFDDDMMYDCVEVTPDFVGRIPAGEKSFYNNSFLLHGYFNYGHLLLGRLDRPGEGRRYFIGVPGTYNNRERMIAAMYGFENFRKSIRRDYKQPYFGYWYAVMDMI